MKLPYHKTSEAIIGYCESNIAKNETNDCVVRAIASSFDFPYDEAHKFVREKFKRKDRDGVYMFIHKMNNLFDNKEQINGKSFKPVGTKICSYYSLDYEVKNQMKKRKMTVGTFTKKYNTGTFVVTVRGHAFTIKNGIVIGNTDDAIKTKRPIVSVWEVV